MSFDPDRIGAFRYLGHEVDAAAGVLTCRYALDDDLHFTERVTVGPGRDWSPPAVAEAARLVFLLAGVSSYKAAAPLTIDLGDTPVRDGERAFLHTFYTEGLGEFAHRNGLDLGGLDVTGGTPAGPPVPWRSGSDAVAGPARRPLIPFGGGIDSIVTVEALRDRVDDAALFVLSRHGRRFAAIEDAAAVTGLPVLRADQELDPQILRSAELGFRNGHVPVTGILSAIALLVAALDRRDAVVMSNEWSASIPTVEVGGRGVNHQWSKSWAFEQGLRAVLAGAFTAPPAYFSFLRPYSELWVAQRFAGLPAYHPVFRSCNRAFHIDPAQRLDRWCGRCDKCCFIDLILAPFMPAADLAAVFDAHEPLDDHDLAPRFRALLASSEDTKPFECVGDVLECRIAALLAAARPDRSGTALLHRLVGELGPQAAAAAGEAQRLLAPLGPTNTPDALAPSDQLV
jgi:UDP-N-acetyl-alpha-D-muramoyl-L-alanyl-L-glutamate epimerase